MRGEEEWLLVLSVTMVVAWIRGVSDVVGVGGFASEHLLAANFLHIV